MKIRELDETDSLTALLHEAEEETIVLKVNGHVRYRVEAIDEDDLIDEQIAQNPAFQVRIRTALDQAKQGLGRSLEEVKRDLLGPT